MNNRQFVILILVLLICFGGFGLHAGLASLYLGGGAGFLLLLILIILLV